MCRQKERVWQAREVGEKRAELDCKSVKGKRKKKKGVGGEKNSAKFRKKRGGLRKGRTIFKNYKFPQPKPQGSRNDLGSAKRKGGFGEKST